MKKLTLYSLAGLLGLVMMTGSTFAASPLRIGFSAEPYPPFTYKAASGQWTGFEIDLATAICAKLDQSCREVPTAWSGIIPALQTGKIDMIMNSMSVTPAREKKISFTRPYYMTDTSYVAPKSMHIKIPQGLKGKTLGVQGGTVAAAYAHRKLVPMGVKVRVYSEQAQLSRDLKAYRVDIMLADSVYAHVFVKRKANKDYAIKGHPHGTQQNIAIGVRKQDDKLKEQLNKAIGTVLKSGKCSQLSEKYFGYDLCAKP